MRTKRFLALISLSGLLFAGPSVAQDAGEDAARERARAVCQEAVARIQQAATAGDGATAQAAVDRLETHVDRMIVCALAPAVIGAAFRLGLAAPGEGEPDAEAHFRHQAAIWWLHLAWNGAPPEEWEGFAALFGLGLTEWPPRLRDAVLDGVEGERAWAVSIAEGGLQARLELVARLHYGIGQARYPAFARVVSDPPLLENPTTAEKRMLGQLLLSPAAGPNNRAGGRFWLRDAIGDRDAIAAHHLGRIELQRGEYLEAYYLLLAAASLGAWPASEDIERAAAALTAEERAEARDRVHHFLRYSASSD